MGETNESDSSSDLRDWQDMVAFAESRDSLRSMAAKLRTAGPPPAPTGRDRSPLILDTDIGGDGDDAIAVAVAAFAAPELALVITTDEHNGERARFARHFLDLLGREDVAVVAGADLGNTRYLSIDGLVPDSVAAQPVDVHDAVTAVLGASTGSVRWVGMGPMTNLAALLAADPHLGERLRVTQMGGAINYRKPDQAEHNFRLDPTAARAVLAAGLQVQLVISDTTFTDELAIDAQSPLYESLAGEAPPWAELLRGHLDLWFSRFYPSTLQHDALTLSVALELPFVGLTRAVVTLDQAARMSHDPDGMPVWISARALYAPFMDWLLRQLTDAEAPVGAAGG